MPAAVAVAAAAAVVVVVVVVVAVGWATKSECFEGHAHPNSPKNYIRLLGGLLPIHSTRRRGAKGLVWGARGPFPPAAAMVVAVVTPVVLCVKATEKINKTLKLVVCYQKV